MKKLCLVLVLSLAVMFLMTSNASAILYLPDLEFNNTGVAAYDATTEKLTVTGTPMNITFDGVTKFAIDTTEPMSVDFFAEYVSGGFSPWIFTGDSSIAPDITITGELVSPPSGFANSGTLITGNISGLEYNDAIGSLGLITGAFDITGGDLYPYYAGTGYQGQYAILLEFTGGVAPTDPNSDWSSAGAKGDISPVPEPSSMLLLGMGLFGLGGAVKRKRFKA